MIKKALVLSLAALTPMAMLLSAVGAPAAGAWPSPPSASPQVSVWETTADGTLLLSPQPSTQFSTAPAANESGCLVEAALYHVELAGPITAAAEIDGPCLPV